VKLSVIDQSPVSAGFTPADALHNTIELARLTDRLGYHRYWIAEHHSIPALASPAPEILIDRVAAEYTASSLNNTLQSCIGAHRARPSLRDSAEYGSAGAECANSGVQDN